MQSLQYRIDIDADREEVWAAITDPDFYKEWASAFSANSKFVGEWKLGSFIDFIDPDMGGSICRKMHIPRRCTTWLTMPSTQHRL